MKIKELIKLLEKIHRQHGNLDVWSEKGYSPKLSTVQDYNIARELDVGEKFNSSIKLVIE